MHRQHLRRVLTIEMEQVWLAAHSSHPILACQPRSHIDGHMIAVNHASYAQLDSAEPLEVVCRP